MISAILLLLVPLIILFFQKNSHLFKNKETNHVEETPTESETIDKNETEEIEETIEKMTFIAAGDLMLHGPQLRGAYEYASDEYDFNSFFEYVMPYFKNADLAMINLETTLAGERLPYIGYPRFNSPDDIIDAMKNAGINLVNTTNNHSFDTGLEGLQRTAKILEENDLDHIGTYHSSPTSRIKMKEINNINVGILAYTEMINNQSNLPVSRDDLEKHINMMDKDTIIQDVQEAKENHADIIIAFMHWGVEYEHEPSETQREYAQFMADEGVDLIIGSHPHVIQPSEELEPDNTFVIYSLGNFVSNQRRETLGDNFSRTEDGLMVQVEIEKNIEEEKTEITAIDYIPTWVHKYQKENGFYDYQVIPVEDFINNKDNIADDHPEIPLDRVQESLDATRKILQIE